MPTYPLAGLIRSFTAFIAAGLAGAASANDTSAELAAGGLVFTQNPDIQMKSEDLYISPEEVRVRYVFVNTANRDVTTRVAFPMPDIVYDGPATNISIPTEDPQNILGFSTKADGRSVQAEVEQKLFANGKDKTALLLRDKLPLAPQLNSSTDRFSALPRTKWDELVANGVAEIEEYDEGGGMKEHLVPRGTVKTTHHWMQTFPAGREITIEHRYQPSVGLSAETAVGDPPYPDERWRAEYKRLYCTDQAFLNGALRLKKTARASQSGVMEKRLAYILKTGANWAGPIQKFRLVVDKEKPGNLISFCAEGVKKISPTTFEVVKSDFIPDQDLHILILEPTKD